MILPVMPVQLLKVMAVDDSRFGILHKEYQSEKMTKEGGMLEVVQLWVNFAKRV